jgi:hypothetical protein
VPYGENVDHVSDSVLSVLYAEGAARTEQGRFTCVVLACRKILMHIAVAQGSSRRVIRHVSFLVEQNFTARRRSLARGHSPDWQRPMT